MFLLVKRRKVESDDGTAEAAQREILMEFFESTNGRNWSRSANWGTDEPLREWEGVNVNEKGNVIGIILASNALSGMYVQTQSFLL